jgi:hypothetical protein
MAARRLVRERDEDEPGRPDHEEEHAQIEEERRRHVQRAEDRKIDMHEMRSEERMVEEQ